MNTRGRQIVGRAVTTDATATKVTLYDSGTANTITLTAKQTVWVTDLDLVAEVGAAIFLTEDLQGDSGTDNADLIAAGVVADNGGIVRNFTTPHQCVKGFTPKFIGAGSGTNYCIIHGFITES